MSVEIKEFIIRTIIKEDSQKTSEREYELRPEDKEEIIAACVQEVLRILRESKER